MSQGKKRSPADDLVKSLIDESREASRSEQEEVGDATVNLALLQQESKEDSSEQGEAPHPDIENVQVQGLAKKKPADGEVDKTLALPLNQEPPSPRDTLRVGGEPQGSPDGRIFGRVTPDKEVRTGGMGSAAEVSLAHSENLRVAQERILELESEVNRLRTENEQLSSAGETLRQRSDRLISRAEKAEADLREEVKTGQAERRILQESLSSKERDNASFRQKVDELEMRLESDLKKIRIRERDLENRLELMKMEEAALLRNKDDIILDLKRRIDQLTSETSNYRNRGLELHKQIEEQQDRFRRTVRALRLALTMLEDSQEEAVPLKRAE